MGRAPKGPGGALRPGEYSMTHLWGTCPTRCGSVSSGIKLPGIKKPPCGGDGSVNHVLVAVNAMACVAHLLNGPETANTKAVRTGAANFSASFRLEKHATAPEPRGLCSVTS